MQLRNIPLKDLLKPKKLKLIATVKPFTMIAYRRLSVLYEHVLLIEKENVQGSFVELGVCNGGSAGIIASIGNHNANRHTWLFDSWEGMPEPTEIDISSFGMRAQKGLAIGDEKKVRNLLFKKLQLNDERIHIIRGWFNETVPVHKKEIGMISLLHLDCDWYESVKFCLDELYDSVVEKGFIFIDDYGDWKGCKRAVDEFVNKNNLRIELTRVDQTGVYFQK